MLKDRLAEIYQALWCSSDGDERPETPSWYLSHDDEGPAPVFYVRHGFGQGERGMFMLCLENNGVVTGGPRIWIWRQLPPDPQDEPDLVGADLEELITLAHERGHEQSCRDRTYQVRAMAEERRAWVHAERILKSLGFEEWTAFEDHKLDSLAEHAKHGTPDG